MILSGLALLGTEGSSRTSTVANRKSGAVVRILLYLCL